MLISTDAAASYVVEGLLMSALLLCSGYTLEGPYNLRESIPAVLFIDPQRTFLCRWIVRKKNIARLNQRESRAYSTGAYYYEYDSSRTASQRRRSSNHSADVTFTEIGMDNLDQSFHDQSKSVYLSISSDIIM